MDELGDVVAVAGRLFAEMRTATPSRRVEIAHELHRQTAEVVARAETDAADTRH